MASLALTYPWVEIASFEIAMNACIRGKFADAVASSHDAIKLLTNWNAAGLKKREKIVPFMAQLGILKMLACGFTWNISIRDAIEPRDLPNFNYVVRHGNGSFSAVLLNPASSNEVGSFYNCKYESEEDQQISG